MKKLKILTVCGFGLGSSMVLKLKVSEVLKKHGIDADVQTQDVGTASSASCDVIFTSYEIGNKLVTQTKTPIVMVKNFLNVNEIEEVGLSLIKELVQG